MSETELSRRLEKLERDYRHLKAFAFGALVLVAALGGIYAAQPIPRKITAHEFDVVDDSGAVRVRMGVRSHGESFIDVNDPQGVVRVAMTMDPLTDFSDVRLADGRGLTRAEMALWLSPAAQPPLDVGPSLVLADARGLVRARVAVSTSGAPSILLNDAQGFSALLGSTATENPKTGETQQTSAASIVMSGKDHSVIWQAP
jgi:hypothetical protein